MFARTGTTMLLRRRNSCCVPTEREAKRTPLNRGIARANERLVNSAPRGMSLNHCTRGQLIQFARESMTQ